MGAEMTAAAPAVATPTLDEIRQWPATVDVTSAARAMGISRAQMYRLIAEGKAPVRVLDFGAKRVVTASLVRLLEAA
ncbi:DNA-binding protein [Streptomyces sp. NPDC006658]|uniref:DNA-binding protein n=1 Tax=Streptomyces sp. NPDC006658 TaxID=3156900 RepID=UPI0033C23FBB